MKLFAARLRTRDYDDMVARWPDCGFDSAEQAVEPYRAAYPHEAEEPTWSTTQGRAQEQQPSPGPPVSTAIRAYAVAPRRGAT